MDIFIDTADINEIKTAFSWGIVDGVTTNPSLIKKAAEKYGGNLADYIKQICQAADGAPVSLEVVGNTYDQMVAEARKLIALFNPVSNNVVIKIPVNPAMDGQHNFFDGLKAIKTLADEEISVNCTLVMTPTQALLAAKAGAAYVSPFCGRLDDYLRKEGEVEFKRADYFPAEGYPTEDGEVMDDEGIVSGVQLIESIRTIFDHANLETDVLASSIRNVRQVREVAESGADIATIPFAVLAAMNNHIKTSEGMKKFTTDVVPEYRQLFSGGSAPPPPSSSPPPQNPGQQMGEMRQPGSGF